MQSSSISDNPWEEKKSDASLTITVVRLHEEDRSMKIMLIYHWAPAASWKPNSEDRPQITPPLYPGNPM